MSLAGQHVERASLLTQKNPPRDGPGRARMWKARAFLDSGPTSQQNLPRVGKRASRRRSGWPVSWRELGLVLVQVRAPERAWLAARVPGSAAVLGQVRVPAFELVPEQELAMTRASESLTGWVPLLSTERSRESPYSVRKFLAQRTMTQRRGSRQWDRECRHRRRSRGRLRPRFLVHRGFRWRSTVCGT